VSFLDGNGKEIKDPPSSQAKVFEAGWKAIRSTGYGELLYNLVESGLGPGCCYNAPITPLLGDIVGKNSNNKLGLFHGEFSSPFEWNAPKKECQGISYLEKGEIILDIYNGKFTLDVLIHELQHAYDNMYHPEMKEEEREERAKNAQKIFLEQLKNREEFFKEFKERLDEYMKNHPKPEYTREVNKK